MFLNFPKYWLTLLVFLVAACSTANVSRYGEIDNTNKSITVPTGSAGLKGDIKAALKKQGWSLKVIGGELISRKTNSSTTKTSVVANTRYSLLIASNEFDRCIGAKMFEPAEHFDISLIDNKTGAEVFTMSGSGCNSKTVESFLAALNN